MAVASANECSAADALVAERWAHLMLKIWTSVVNGTRDRDHAGAERWARRPFRRVA
jgi:hypothetical protein